MTAEDTVTQQLIASLEHRPNGLDEAAIASHVVYRAYCLCGWYTLWHNSEDNAYRILQRHIERELGRCKRCGLTGLILGGVCRSCADDLRDEAKEAR